MASQIYSRYIPPSKKNTPIIAPIPVPPPIELPALNPIPISTTKDASSTYARYVPPAKPKTVSQPIIKPVSPPQIPSSTPTKRKHDASDEEAEQQPQKPKKQKKAKIFEPVILSTTGTELLAQESWTNVLGETSKVKGSKSRSKKIEVLDNTKDAEDEDARHTKLLAKREKSLRKSEKIARKAAKEVPEAEIVVEEPPELHDLVPLPQPDPVPEAPQQSTTASLPSWLAEPIRILPTTSAPFIDLGVPKEVVEGLQKKGFKSAFALQTALLPLLLPGDAQKDGDFLISAATGSGKTLSYVLPMIEHVARNQITKLRGLIVLPTRELVTQAKEVSEMCASLFSGRRRLRIGTAVGNEAFKAEQFSLMEEELVYDPDGYKKQLERLNGKWEDSESGSDGDLIDEETISSLPDHIINPISKVDVLICTPGRLVEHLKATPGFTLENVQWLVVDEADKLLDQSFQDWLDVVMVSLTKPRKVILSATMTRNVGKLNGLKLHRPRLIVVEGEQKEESQALFLPSLLEESGIKVDDEGAKPLYLIEVLRNAGLILHGDQSKDDSSSDDDTLDEEAPKADPQAHGALIFTKSNESAVRLGRLIALLAPALSSKIGTLTSTTRSSDRKAALKQFDAGKISILVASDLVSRGLDLSNLAHVVNYDLPTSLTSYVHRVGRTARAGKKGHAWSLFTAVEGRWFWNEIGRSEGVRRSGKVERVRLDIVVITGRQEEYERALAMLEKESNESARKKK